MNVMAMNVDDLSLEGAKVLTAPRHVDERGAFSELFNARDLEAAGITDRFVQDNLVFSHRAGTLRGLHFQRPPHAQAKLVRVLRGRIWDVMVDLRRDSPTYGTWDGVELSAENWSQVYVPVGFAHAYLTLEDDTEVLYKVSDFYAPQCEGGIIWNDPDLAIDWPLQGRTPQLSERDAALGHFAELAEIFDRDTKMAGGEE